MREKVIRDMREKVIREQTCEQKKEISGRDRACCGCCDLKQGLEWVFEKPLLVVGGYCKFHMIGKVQRQTVVGQEEFYSCIAVRTFTPCHVPTHTQHPPHPWWHDSKSF
jgi:hypothetical protein